MSIYFHSEDIVFPKIKKTPLKNWIKQVVQKEQNTVGDINIIFTSDNHLLKINKEFLNHDYFTDVITFDYTEKLKISGDIFISIDRVCDNAKSLNISTTHELNRIIIHGILHLLGYKDKNSVDKLVMTNKENTYLELL